jgi:hypothetical protein
MALNHQRCRSDSPPINHVLLQPRMQLPSTFFPAAVTNTRIKAAPSKGSGGLSMTCRNPGSAVVPAFPKASIASFCASYTSLSAVLPCLSARTHIHILQPKFLCEVLLRLQNMLDPYREPSHTRRSHRPSDAWRKCAPPQRSNVPGLIKKLEAERGLRPVSSSLGMLTSVFRRQLR